MGWFNVTKNYKNFKKNMIKKKKNILFPRVLIISEFSFNGNSGGNLLFKNLFEDFPKENIALLHKDNHFDNSDFGLSLSIKKKKKIFDFFTKFFSPEFKSYIKSSFSSVKIYEKIKIDPFIRKSIQRFKPDVIYTILGDNEMMHLIKLIHKYFNIPLVIHIMDNWIYEKNYNRCSISKMNYFKFFVENAKKNIAINKRMAEVYSKEYSQKFEIIHNAISKEKIKEINNNNSRKKVTYIGSIYKNAQLDSVQMIAKSVIGLSKRDINIEFEIYLPKNQFDQYKSKFPKHESIKLNINSFNDDEYFTMISKSNLLILASNFDNNSIGYYKYSWPAKMPSYLMSRVPIFILGPLEIYFISEAKKKSWALVCDKFENIEIENSILRILFDEKLKNKILSNALLESKQFELIPMKEKFKNILNQATKI